VVTAYRLQQSTAHTPNQNKNLLFDTAVLILPYIYQIQNSTILILEKLAAKETKSNQQINLMS